MHVHVKWHAAYCLFKSGFLKQVKPAERDKHGTAAGWHA